MKSASRTRGLIICLLALFAVYPTSLAAQISGIDRDVAVSMLNSTKDAIKKEYYDPTFHGVDIDFVFEQALQRIKSAESRDALTMTIASAVLALDDSHTTFFPPARAADIDYGWLVEMFGDDCYVTHVKPGSDAEAKGVKVGDKLVAIDGFKPTRNNLWKMYYRFYSIAPTAGNSMTLLSPNDAQPHVIGVRTKISKTATVVSLQSMYDRGVIKRGWDDTKKVSEFQEFGKDLLIWKMHTFNQSESNIDTAVAEAKKHKAVILDLRDNGGGDVDILKRMVGAFFDKDMKISDQKMRKETKSLMSKSRGKDGFSGDLIVLIGHESASASEVFARLVQLEKRGKIIGDRSAGAVMESKFHSMDTGVGNQLWFGASITMADLIMPDGKSLEKVGVIPDETILPTGADLIAQKDPLLSYAAKQFGVDLAPEVAGKFFPYTWPK